MGIFFNLTLVFVYFLNFVLMVVCIWMCFFMPLVFQSQTLQHPLSPSFPLSAGVGESKTIEGWQLWSLLHC